MSYKLVDFNITKEEAEDIAHDLIKNKYGNLPSTGKPYLEGTFWIVPINVKYPRVFFDKNTNRPKKIRFMNFEKIGEIKIDANKGVPVEKPNYYTVRSEINERLDFIKTNVEKALVKVGADKFSKLPLSEHMHTPIEDIISYLLINDSIDLNTEFSNLSNDILEKYIKNVDSLIKVGLVRKTESNLLIPDNALIEIESISDILSNKLSKSLSYFFAEGYEDISSIRQVLGPYLSITGHIYEQSIEYDEIMPVNYFEIQNLMKRYYREFVKQFKIPRYLIQLIEVGLIKQEIINGENVWLPTKKILENIKGEDEILSPIKELFIPNII